MNEPQKVEAIFGLLKEALRPFELDKNTENELLTVAMKQYNSTGSLSRELMQEMGVKAAMASSKVNVTEILPRVVPAKIEYLSSDEIKDVYSKLWDLYENYLTLTTNKISKQISEAVIKGMNDFNKSLTTTQYSLVKGDYELSRMTLRNLKERLTDYKETRNTYNELYTIEKSKLFKNKKILDLYKSKITELDERILALQVDIEENEKYVRIRQEAVIKLERKE